jgi:hypothetical protein
MPTLLDQIQPCDGRDLLQKLLYSLVVELAEKKVAICNQATNVFAEFGFENFSICQGIDDSILKLLEEGNTVAAYSAIMVLAGLPPHSLKILQQGYDSLTEEEKKEVEVYLQRQGRAAIQGAVLAIVQEEIFKKLKCPTPVQGQIILNTVTNISAAVNRISNKFQQLQRVVNIASSAVNALNVAIQTSETTVIGLDISLPATAATPTGASGLIARGISRLERFIDNKKDEIKALDDRLCNAAKVVQHINAQLFILQALLQVIDALLRVCSLQSIELTAVIAPRTPSGGTEALTYRGYTIEIRTASGEYVAPLRYAVAIDRQGVVVLQGPRSYSSSTEVLIEEIKFRIDNQLG